MALYCQIFSSTDLSSGVVRNTFEFFFMPWIIVWRVIGLQCCHRSIFNNCFVISFSLQCVFKVPWTVSPSCPLCSVTDCVCQGRPLWSGGPLSVPLWGCWFGLDHRPSLSAVTNINPFHRNQITSHFPRQSVTEPTFAKGIVSYVEIGLDSHSFVKGYIYLVNNKNRWFGPLLIELQVNTPLGIKPLSLWFQGANWRKG